MTPIEQARVTARQDKLKAQIAKLKDQLQLARAKNKGGASARSRGGAARPASSKGRTRARTRSVRGGESVASA